VSSLLNLALRSNHSGCSDLARILPEQRNRREGARQRPQSRTRQSIRTRHRREHERHDRGHRSAAAGADGAAATPAERGQQARSDRAAVERDWRCAAARLHARGTRAHFLRTRRRHQRGNAAGLFAAKSQEPEGRPRQGCERSGRRGGTAVAASRVRARHPDVIARAGQSALPTESTRGKRDPECASLGRESGRERASREATRRQSERYERAVWPEVDCDTCAAKAWRAAARQTGAW
jgi:hypothetical protein